MYKHIIVALLALGLFQENTQAQYRGFNADSRDYEGIMDQLETEEKFNDNCISFKNKTYINEQGEKVYLSLNCEEKTLIVHVDNQSITLSKRCEENGFKSYMLFMPFDGTYHKGISLLEYTLELSFQIDQEDKISSNDKSRKLLDFEYNLAEKIFTLSSGLEKPFDLDRHDINSCRCRYSDKVKYSDGFAITQSSCCHTQGGSQSRVRCHYQTTFSEIK